MPEMVSVMLAEARGVRFAIGREDLTPRNLPPQRLVDDPTRWACRSRSGVGGPAQALELAPQALARAPVPTSRRHRWPGHWHDRRAVVDVAGRGDGGPDARLDRQGDLDDALAMCYERLNPIARANLRRRLGRRSIHADVAAVAQPDRKRAGLHEAHRAQPAIDTSLVGDEGISHAFKDGTADDGAVAVYGCPSPTQCVVGAKRKWRPEIE